VDRRPLGDVVDELQRAGSEANENMDQQREVGIYAANVPIEHILPEFAELLRPISTGVAHHLRSAFGPQVPGTPSLYLGAGSQRTPLHFDPTENLTIVLQGTKLFRLFPPSASSQLQPRGGLLAAAACWTAGVVPAVYSDFDAWMATSGRPAAADVVVRAGEVLYLPPGWWHAVAGSAEPNVTVVFGYAPSEAKGARYFQRLRLPFL